MLLSKYQILFYQNIYDFIGEIGFKGEIKPVSFIKNRITKIKISGFKTIIISNFNIKNLNNNDDIEIINLNNISEYGILKSFIKC